MSDFRAKIIAELDTKKIPSSIKNIEKQKITLMNFTLDTKGLPSEIQASLDKHKFTINLDGIKSKILILQLVAQRNLLMKFS